MKMKNEFGKHLNAIRAEKNISFDDLARKTGIASWVLWSYEEGKEIPKKPIVHLISRALNCNAKNLLRSRLYSLTEKRKYKK